MQSCSCPRPLLPPEQNVTLWCGTAAWADTPRNPPAPPHLPLPCRAGCPGRWGSFPVGSKATLGWEGKPLRGGMGDPL